MNSYVVVVTRAKAGRKLRIKPVAESEELLNSACVGDTVHVVAEDFLCDQTSDLVAEIDRQLKEGRFKQL